MKKTNFRFFNFLNDLGEWENGIHLSILNDQLSNEGMKDTLDLLDKMQELRIKALDLVEKHELVKEDGYYDDL